MVWCAVLSFTGKRKKERRKDVMLCYVMLIRTIRTRTYEEDREERMTGRETRSDQIRSDIVRDDMR